MKESTGNRLARTAFLQLVAGGVAMPRVTNGRITIGVPVLIR